ncbi:MAG TPA: nucleotide exchange factor GrpE [Cyclobacteriaceae bacterium]|nr:nucleotide exchange factor GrpE [Cyclobacteriaceae bacterium]HMV08316.1 nucleotide exchange factor GrpE [Cyclobacteriaceae bacterium]HMV88407.1 nucleotide exchange factor GrpE [Cyclobacteriaceae bacterium]HMX02159.1 nucleotide exchange factor GrpE [Cyclobacteriaceae bacterium]HMX49865.1 nucleotide exchange factor GrpE [Cyclobacteriaceae bacterium]
MENNNPQNEQELNEVQEKTAAETSQSAESTGTTDLKKAQDELADAKDKYLRLYSEFENFRRRTAREKLDLIQSANEKLVNAFLPIIDDFERAEKAFKGSESKEMEGFLLIYNKFKKILDQAGVKVMEAKGSDFNPDLHEAITQVPAPNESMKGKVMDVVENGYLLNDKVIRFAKVVVGS